jgi:hypothetical protein
MPIIVNAIYRVPKWTFAYISKKIFQFVPTFTHFNTARSVPFIGAVISSIASTHHTTPNKVERVVGLPVCMIAFFTTAGTVVAVVQVPGLDDTKFAAVAFAEPFTAVFTMDYDQSTKTLTRDIFEFGHDDLYRRLLWQVARLVSTPASLRTLA